MEQNQARRPDPPRNPPESTWGNSAAASSETVCTHQNNDGLYTTWTNEKHNSYIADLEASFIVQLQNSLGSKKKRVGTSLSRATLNDAEHPFDQFRNFAVSQGGVWRKKIFGKDRLLPYSAAGSYFSMKSSRLRYLLDSEKLTNMHKLSFSEYPFLFHLWNQDTVGTLSEGSDQNFINEGQGEKRNISSSTKQLTPCASPEDQIVPSGNILMKERTSSVGENVRFEKLLSDRDTTYIFEKLEQMK